VRFPCSAKVKSPIGSLPRWERRPAPRRDLHIAGRPASAVELLGPSWRRGLSPRLKACEIVQRNKCRGAVEGSLQFQPSENHAGVARLKSLLVVLHTVSERKAKEILIRRGACIRIAAPGRRLRKGGGNAVIQFAAVIPDKWSAHAVLDLICLGHGGGDEGSSERKSFTPAWEVASARPTAADAVHVLEGRAGPDDRDPS